MNGSGMTFDRSPAGDLWRHTLSQIPTTFGRMVYLSSLRDLNTGIYRHYGMAQQFTEHDTDQVLRNSHIRAFEEWVAFDLEGKKSDLDLYLASIEGDRRQIVEAWINLKPFRNLVPAGVPQVSVDLYLSSLDTLLHLLMNVHGVSEPHPDA